MSERAISATATEIAHIVEVVLHHPLQLIPLSNMPQTQKIPAYLSVSGDQHYHLMRRLSDSARILDSSLWSCYP